MSRADTWMPLYVADYARDTLHLTTEQHGAYMLLLMACWTRGGDLPADDGQLAGIVRMTPAAWRRVAPLILAFFRPGEAGGWSHKRVKAEHEKATRNAEVSRQNGQRGGRPKSKNEPGENPPGSSQVTQGETPAQIARPSPSPPPSEVSEAAIASSATTRRAKPRQAVPDGWMPTDAGRRHAVERGMPPEAIEGQVERFRDHHAAKGSTFANIDAAWRTWAGNFNDFKPQLRVAHDRDASRNDRRSAAHLERLQDVAAASEVAARAWRPPGGH